MNGDINKKNYHDDVTGKENNNITNDINTGLCTEYETNKFLAENPQTSFWKSVNIQNDIRLLAMKLLIEQEMENKLVSSGRLRLLWNHAQVLFDNLDQKRRFTTMERDFHRVPQTILSFGGLAPAHHKIMSFTLCPTCTRSSAEISARKIPSGTQRSRQTKYIVEMR